MHIGLLDNDAFRRLTADARFTFLVSIMLAGKQNQDGRLEIRGVGPMTVEEIARYTNIPTRRQAEALDQLTKTEFLTRDMAGCYVVERFSEKVGDVSTDRTKRYRERHKNGKGTSQERSGDALEEEVEVEVDIPKTIVFGSAWLKTWSKLPDDRCVIDPESVSWLDLLGVAFSTIAEKPLRNLGVDERVIMARVHAAVLGNSRIDEAKNRAKAASLAAPIARLSTSRLGEITCRQYVKFGLKTLEIRGGKPFWNPFDVEAAIEYEPR